MQQSQGNELLLVHNPECTHYIDIFCIGLRKKKWPHTTLQVLIGNIYYHEETLNNYRQTYINSDKTNQMRQNKIIGGRKTNKQISMVTNCNTNGSLIKIFLSRLWSSVLISPIS